MANKSKVMDSIKDFLLKLKALDVEIPNELAEDACDMVECVKEGLNEDEDINTFEKNEPCTGDSLSEELTEKKIEDVLVNVLKKYGLVKDPTMESLDALEEELSNDEDPEEGAYADPEKMNDSASLIRKIKPVIAGVKDSKTRKILSDSFVKAIKMNTKNQYGDVFSAVTFNANDMMSKAKDSKITQQNDYDFGMQIAKKYNPHYNEEV